MERGSWYKERNLTRKVQMKKYNLGIIEKDDEVILFEERKNIDLEIENFKSVLSCIRYLNKNYKRIDNSFYKYYGTYIKTKGKRA
jgi:hypothetical protein